MRNFFKPRSPKAIAEEEIYEHQIFLASATCAALYAESKINYHRKSIEKLKEFVLEVGDPV